MYAYRIFLFLCVIFLWPLSSRADETTPLFYSRATLAIIRKNPPPEPLLPWQDKPASLEKPEVVLGVEVRDATTLYNQRGWFNLSSQSADTGIFMPFSVPVIASIGKMMQYAPLDILFIDREGKITQIIPNIKLATLDQDIMPESPILAFLFLQGGVCAKLSIMPGDTVDYKIFKKPPLVLKDSKQGGIQRGVDFLQPVAPAPVPDTQALPAAETH